MKIAIPTYGRQDIKTLKILSAFEPKDIYIFPNNYNTENLVKEIERLSKEYPNVNIEGLMTKGIPAARNAILDYFNKDKQLIMLDDDIEIVYKLGVDEIKVKNDLQELEPKEIKEFFENAFQICQLNNTKLWGIYPIQNAFYMKHKINNKGFIIGTMFGVITSDIRFDENLLVKEDYDFTMQHIQKYKKVARFDYITIKAEHYTNSGGCVDLRKATNIEEECFNYLLKKWSPNIIKNPKRENEVLINL